MFFSHVKNAWMELNLIEDVSNGISHVIKDDLAIKDDVLVDNNLGEWAKGDTHVKSYEDKTGINDIQKRTKYDTFDDIEEERPEYQIGGKSNLWQMVCLNLK